MKTLLLLRHAKSSWKDADLADFDRPLNERGERAAPFMGKLIAERGITPSLVLSSPANRARTTAELVTDAGGFDAQVILDDRIYEASPGTLLQVAGETDQPIDSLMLVGHNPGMEATIRVLTGESERMPTAAVAIIDIDITNWKDIAPGTGKLRAIYRPRDEME